MATKVKNKKIKIPKKGDKIYVDTSLHISRGSDDFCGGIATVDEVTEGISGGKKCIFVTIEEDGGCCSRNWSQHLAKEQGRLKKEFGNAVAHPDPDIDTPWIEDGDIVNGEKYNGPPIW